VPKQHGKAGEKMGDWLKIEFTAPIEMIDALNNFVTEIGAQGAFQETQEPLPSNTSPHPPSGKS
jgi:ribosomal protein L11 methyltransferase